MNNDCGIEVERNLYVEQENGGRHGWCLCTKTIKGAYYKSSIFSVS